jgi:hypothetical protein
MDGNNTNVGGQKPPSVSPQGKHEDSDRSLFSHDDEDENADVESDGSLFPSDDDDKQKPPATAGKPKETDGEYLKARKNQYKRSSHAFNDSDLVITPVVREEKRLDYFRFIFEGVSHWISLIAFALFNISLIVFLAFFFSVSR